MTALRTARPGVLRGPKANLVMKKGKNVGHLIQCQSTVGYTHDVRDVYLLVENIYEHMTCNMYEK